MPYVADIMKNRRKERGMTLPELARQVNDRLPDDRRTVSYFALKNAETGRYEVATDVLTEIANVLDLNLEELVKEDPT